MSESEMGLKRICSVGEYRVVKGESKVQLS